MSTPTDDPFSPQPLPQESPSSTPSRTAVLDREEATEERVEPGDHERFAHYVQKDKITESAVTGTPVTTRACARRLSMTTSTSVKSQSASGARTPVIALCGKVWVPGRDPQRFPVCPTCKEIYQGLQRGAGGGKGGGGKGDGGGSGS